jgi:hypothetical protein
VRPRVVHLHSFTHLSELMLDAARDASLRTVVTYLVPAVSCTRGTMLRMGGAPCDGRLEVRRCTACTLVARGRRPLAARAVAAMPAGIARRVGGPFAATAKIADAHERFSAFMAKLDRVVATSALSVCVRACGGRGRWRRSHARWRRCMRALPDSQEAADRFLQGFGFGR